MKEFDKKISFRLLNVSLTFLVIYLFGKTMFVWQPILITIKNILIPFLIAFAIAYALYPIILKLREKGMRKSFAIFFLIFVLIFFIGFIVYLLIPLLVEQLNSLFNWLLEIIPNVSNKYDVNLSFVQEYLGDFNSILGDFSKFLGDISINVINQTINIFTIALISFIAIINFLVDMDKIRAKVKKFLSKKSKKTYNYIKNLDYEMINIL